MRTHARAHTRVSDFLPLPVLPWCARQAMDLEGETFRSLLDIIRLSADLESRGSGSQNTLKCSRIFPRTILTTAGNIFCMKPSILFPRATVPNC